MFYQTKPHADRQKGRKCRFLFLVTLTFDLDLQIRPSEGPITYSCKFGANPFSGYRDISYTNKKVTDSPKNRTVPHQTLFYTVYTLTAASITLASERNKAHSIVIKTHDGLVRPTSQFMPEIESVT